MKNIIALAAAATLLAASIPADARRRLDAHFVAGRVFVDYRTMTGSAVRFYTDTGGGGTLLYPSAVKRLRLRARIPSGPAAAGLPPTFRELIDDPRLVGAPLPTGPILVAPDFIAEMGGPAEADGFLGAPWFAERIWTWDYRAGTLTQEDDDWRPAVTAAVIPVTFRSPEAGRPMRPFPRITVTLAGEPTSMLLDTGAETLLSPEALGRVGGGPALQATSMIVSSRFAAWRAAHPEWPFVEHAQVRTGASMIQVPDVTIAGIQVGPVWFTERPDANFHGMMSSAMDAQAEGAIGGNAFRDLRMTVDYCSKRATFEHR